MNPQSTINMKKMSSTELKGEIVFKWCLHLKGCCVDEA